MVSRIGRSALLGPRAKPKVASDGDIADPLAAENLLATIFQIQRTIGSNGDFDIDKSISRAQIQLLAGNPASSEIHDNPRGFVHGISLCHRDDLGDG